MISCLFLRLIAESKVIGTSSVGGANASPIPPLSTICDDYINTIGEHAYDPDCEDPGFVFKNFSEYDTHSLYPRQIHRAYRPHRLKFNLINLEQKSCKFME